MSFPTGSYVLFYYADEHSIGIARILHGSRDLATAFRKISSTE
jgi:plasmid stabilization system protein ParE